MLQARESGGPIQSKVGELERRGLMHETFNEILRRINSTKSKGCERGSQSK